MKRESKVSMPGKRSVKRRGFAIETLEIGITRFYVRVAPGVTLYGSGTPGLLTITLPEEYIAL